MTFARRVGVAGARTPASAAALDGRPRAARRRSTRVLRARLAGDPPPAAAARHRRGRRPARRSPPRRSRTDGDALAWTWPAADAHTPVHRLAHAAIELITSEADLARLRDAPACRWLFLDHSRGAGRRWCSMADCGTEAKKRRYVQRRRERLRASRT